MRLSCVDNTYRSIILNGQTLRTNNHSQKKLLGIGALALAYPVFIPPSLSSTTTPSFPAIINKKCVLLCRTNFKHRKILPHALRPYPNPPKPLRDIFPPYIDHLSPLLSEKKGSFVVSRLIINISLLTFSTSVQP